MNSGEVYRCDGHKHDIWFTWLHGKVSGMSSWTRKDCTSSSFTHKSVTLLSVGPCWAQREMTELIELYDVPPLQIGGYPLAAPPMASTFTLKTGDALSRKSAASLRPSSLSLAISTPTVLSARLLHSCRSSAVGLGCWAACGESSSVAPFVPLLCLATKSVRPRFIANRHQSFPIASGGSSMRHSFRRASRGTSDIWMSVPRVPCW